MTTHIDDKLPISGDAAETIAAYLEELNYKLILERVEGAYAIVAETENLILDAMKTLGKSTKATVDDVLGVLKTQGSPDDIVKQHTKMSNIDYFEEESKPVNIEPTSRKLPKRQGAVPMGVIDVIKKVFLARLYLILPILFLSIALLNLWQEQSVPFLIASAVLFMTHELYTGITGNLLEEYSITSLMRRIYRSLLFAGTFLIFSASRVYHYLEVDYYDDYVYMYDQLKIWMILFFMTEFLVLVRDHIPNFHPLEPKFQPLIRFFTAPYLILFTSIVLLVLPLNPFSQYLKMRIYLILSVSATLSTIIVKFRSSLRFYLTALSVTLVPGIVFTISEVDSSPQFDLNRYLIYLNIHLISLLYILYKQYKRLIHTELSDYLTKIGDSYKSY